MLVLFISFYFKTVFNSLPQVGLDLQYDEIKIESQNDRPQRQEVINCKRIENFSNEKKHVDSIMQNPQIEVIFAKKLTLVDHKKIELPCLNKSGPVTRYRLKNIDSSVAARNGGSKNQNMKSSAQKRAKFRFSFIKKKCHDVDSDNKIKFNNDEIEFIRDISKIQNQKFKKMQKRMREAKQQKNISKK
ncbi:hypothetical protein EDEG_02681 [Edhazardia aedis USNM 41457]|uniref:Uncharacterized protein n=1 Tax=Edhazardia aedis (strain USNM 41457) TaxID=1003232 RepID=J9D528_EDHAE|nr:hypothetical protein EDEG_02681 [Edhazardia aedis USNM 41457]|eukprot:EJW02916.1 hypothetical protein EDEG_02681 [Edhazardia aedis USNM 41457]